MYQVKWNENQLRDCRIFLIFICALGQKYEKRTDSKEKTQLITNSIIRKTNIQMAIINN